MADKSKKELGFAIIGLGFGLSRCPLIQKVPGARLACVVARHEDKAREAAKKFGVDWHTDYRKVLERDDVDVVGIYTSSGSHMEIAMDAANAGKHVLVTKPIEVTLDRIDAIIEACRKAGVKLATEFVMRYKPSNYALYDAMDKGRFGKMVLGEFAEKCYRPQWYYEIDGGWRSTWKGGGGGVMSNQGIHPVDQMLWLFGDIGCVSAKCGTYGVNIETEDTAVSLIEFRSGAIGVIVATTTFQTDRPPGRYGGALTRRVEVNGVDGGATIVDDKITMWKAPEEDQAPSKIELPAMNVFEDFTRWIQDDDYSSPTLVKAEQSRAAMEVVLAMYQSAKEGKPVNLPLR